MLNLFRNVSLSLAISLVTLPSSASELSHTFKSPAFNGVGYSSHVLTIENLQHTRKKDIKAKEESDAKEAEREAENTNVNKFLKNLESRIYAELSKQIAEQLFGEDQQTSGQIDLLGNNVQYSIAGDMVTLVVSESDGTVTTVEIPVGAFAL